MYFMYTQENTDCPQHCAAQEEMLIERCHTSKPEGTALLHCDEHDEGDLVTGAWGGIVIALSTPHAPAFVTQGIAQNEGNGRTTGA